MVSRSVVTLASLLAVTPAFAEPMNAEAARRFVAGKLFSFTCFEGSSGTGRIFNDGSVAGLIRMGKSGQARFMHLPAGALYPTADRICSNLKGAFVNPCFDLTRTSDRSFRGTISGFRFAYCDFMRRDGRAETVQASVAPVGITPIPVRTIRRGHRGQQEKSAAAPTTSVTSAPLPSIEQATFRSSISP
jgi:hypothetical protein